MNVKPIKVLLVEDNPEYAHLIQESLADAKAAGPVTHTFDLLVEYADRLSAGLERLTVGDVDLILLDLSLPDGHGLGTLAKVQAQAPQVPIVVLTNPDDEAVAVKAVREGAQDYLIRGKTDGSLLLRAMLYAIQRKRAEDALERRARQLAFINDIGKRITAALDLDEVLDRATRLVQESLGYYHVGLFLLDETTGELKIQAMAGGLAGMIPSDHRLALGEGTVGWTAETGQPLLANDVSQEPRYALSMPDEALTKAELCVPLKLANKVIGVLDIQSTQLNAFNETDLMAMEILADQLAVAIENARLHQETLRRLEETKTLSTVTIALTRSLDPDQVLPSIVESATRLIPAGTNGVIHLVDEATGKLIPRATSPEVNIQRSEMPIWQSITGLVVQEKRPINVPNVEKDPRFLPVDTPTAKKSLLTVPLMIDGDCIGTLSLNSDRVGAFSADDERLLTTLAAQAAVAVRNARLHREVQRRVEELTFLNQVGRTVTSSLNLEQTLATVMEGTTHVLGTEAGSILLFNGENNELVFEAAVGLQSEQIRGRRFPLGQGIAGWVAREGQSLLVPNVREDPRFYPGIDGATGFFTRSILAVPLKVKGTVIGVIEVVNKTEGDFNYADLALLSSMAQSAAIAIENAQLFAETQRRFEEMAALYNVSLDIIARLEMPELMKSIVERAVGLLKSKAGGVYLYNPERQELRLAIGYDYTEKYAGVTLKPGEGITGKVFQTGEPLIVNDYCTWEGKAAVHEADQPFNAVLGVPLKWQERVIGVLTINAEAEKRTFNQNDIWLATLFANQVAIAIENARLYAELQDRMEELKRTQAHLLQSEKLVALGRLSASLAHEINNPLQSVIGCLGLAKEALAEGESVDPYIRVAHEEVRRVARTVTQMRDLYRPESGKKEPTGVNALLEQVLELSRKQCQENQIEVVWEPAPNLPPLLMVADRIRQVFLNLILNAIQAMPTGGRLQVSTAYTRQPKGVRIEFTDSGEGIPPDVLSHLFEPFYSTKPDGTGLGLSISHSIVEQHRGYIEVESPAGEGSTFTVWLPA